MLPGSRNVFARGASRSTSGSARGRFRIRANLGGCCVSRIEAAVRKWNAEI